MSGAKWSGTEGRHRQDYIAPDRIDRHGVCECVALKCHGTMNTIGDGSKIKCDVCGLIIKNVRKIKP